MNLSFAAEGVCHDTGIETGVGWLALNDDKQLVLSCEEVPQRRLQRMTVLEPFETRLGAARRHALEDGRLALGGNLVLHMLHKRWCF